MAILPSVDWNTSVEVEKSAPVDNSSLPSGEGEPAAGADTSRFELNVQSFVYAIDQRSVDWDPLPAFIASPSDEYLAMLEAAE